jgi:hypothetical protein
MDRVAQNDLEFKTIEKLPVFEKVEGLFEMLAQSLVDADRIDQVERELFKGLLALGRELLTSFVNKSGVGDLGESIDDSEHGKLTRSAEKRTRCYQSIFGELKIERWVYHKREGQKALRLPLDQKLALPKQKQSYVLEDWLQRMVTKEPYAEAVDDLWELLGIKTSVRSAERMNRDLAQYVPGFQETLLPPDPKTEQPIKVVTCDGKGVLVRRTLNQRKHQAIGTKLYQPQSTLDYEKTDKRRTTGANKSKKQMAYVGAIYSIAPFVRTVDDVLGELAKENQPLESRPQRPSPQNKRLSVEMTQIKDGQLDEGPDRLFSKLQAQLARRAEDDSTVVCLMDGQRSLWFQQREYFPTATPILDLFHVMEYLWQAAYCFHPQGSVAAEEFVNKYLRMLLEGKVGYVIGAFRRKASGLSGKPAASLNKVINYFDKNRNHMRYDEYLAEGYPIGSGVVEGACRHLVKDRMEQSGMRWEMEGAQDVLSLRANYLNNDWQQLIEYRINTEQNAIYSAAA